MIIGIMSDGFPNGNLNAEGEVSPYTLEFRVQIGHERGMLQLSFDREARAFAMTAEDAKDLAKLIDNEAERIINRRWNEPISDAELSTKK